jgi:hypothetical protein
MNDSRQFGSGTDEMNKDEQPQQHQRKGQPITGSQPPKQSAHQSETEQSGDADKTEREWRNVCKERPTAMIPVWIEAVFDDDVAAHDVIDKVKSAEYE